MNHRKVWCRQHDVLPLCWTTCMGINTSTCNKCQSECQSSQFQGETWRFGQVEKLNRVRPLCLCHLHLSSGNLPTPSFSTHSTTETLFHTHHAIEPLQRGVLSSSNRDSPPHNDQILGPKSSPPTILNSLPCR